MRLAKAAVVVLLASWSPLLAVGLLDPAANPIGLGLLAMAGSALAAALGAAAAIRAIARVLRGGG